MFIVALIVVALWAAIATLSAWLWRGHAMDLRGELRRAYDAINERDKKELSKLWASIQSAK